jgi:hypothetical protein
MAKASDVVTAFLGGEPKSVGNLQTDGKSLWLFGNLIAEHRDDGLHVTHAGWETRTTFNYLNQLPNVKVYRSKKQTYLNGRPWDGSMTQVTLAPPPVVKKTSKAFIRSKKWVATDGWRGYFQPVYAVAGANDTGTWSDSPCPSHVATKELQGISSALKAAKVPTKEMICETTNVFCIHRYLIVPPPFLEKAKKIVDVYVDEVPTQLLYKV